MSGLYDQTLSARGQIVLPEGARRRWGVEAGDEVEVIDLGYCVMTLPRGGVHRLLADALPADEHAAFVRSLADDDDLATT